MNDLKQTMFNETLRAFNGARLEYDRYGFRTNDYENKLAAFCALYELIETCGLEDEYKTWKAKEGEHSVVDCGNLNLPKCVTGESGSGVCGNRDCIERQGIGCCVACKTMADCNSACGWLEEPAKT